MALGQTLATRRLAGSVLVELDRCFAALGLTSVATSGASADSEAASKATSGEVA